MLTSACNLKGLSYLYNIFCFFPLREFDFYTSLAIFIFYAFQVCKIFTYLKEMTGVQTLASVLYYNFESLISVVDRVLLFDYHRV